LLAEAPATPAPRITEEEMAVMTKPFANKFLIFMADLSISVTLALSGCKSTEFDEPDKNPATFEKF
jgi:hypothetical protein